MGNDAMRRILFHFISVIPLEIKEKMKHDNQQYQRRRENVISSFLLSEVFYCEAIFLSLFMGLDFNKRHLNTK